ncbi:MAG: extracellular solute-binding protein [Candidatus Sumerlaeota bacterium]|nr:extracellular solute-binding protein [Candidatus Sumerlaeota bacterium]
MKSADLTKYLKIAAGIALAVGLVALLASPGPPLRKYPDRIPVRFWHMWSAEWKVVVDDIVTSFNLSQDKYEVIALSVPGNAADSKFLLSAVGGDPPDCMAQWNAVIPTWADNQLLMPLDELMSPAERERFDREAYPIVKKIGSYKGHFYGLTTGLNIWGLYYLPEHLRQAGLDPDHMPDTLEEMFAWGEKLNRYDNDGNLIRLGYMPRWFMMSVKGFNGGFYDWKSGKLTINTPENLRCLTYLADCHKKIGFDKVKRYESGLNQGFGVEWPFISGAYSITLDGQWRVKQLSNFAPNLEYRIAPLPPPAGGLKDAGWSNGNFMIVPRVAHHPEGAWEFIKFWSGLDHPERAAEYYTWGGWLPLSQAVAQAPAYQEYLKKFPQFKTFLDILPSENIDPTPPVAIQVFLMDQIQLADDRAIRDGSMSPAQALLEAEHNIEQELERRREVGYKD